MESQFYRISRDFHQMVVKFLIHAGHVVTHLCLSLRPVRDREKDGDRQIETGDRQMKRDKGKGETVDFI